MNDGPKAPVTPEYIVLQRGLQKPECMSILAKEFKQILHLKFQIFGSSKLPNN
jgi:hypothetical protein